MSGRRQRWLYLIGSDEARAVKIGISFNPEQRMEELQVGSPVALRLLWKTPGGRDMEQALHECFHAYLKHGEWFDFGDENPVALVAGTAALLRYWRPPAEVAGLPPHLPPAARNSVSALAASTPARGQGAPARRTESKPDESEWPTIALPPSFDCPAEETC